MDDREPAKEAEPAMSYTLTLNDQLTLSWPSGFHVMNEEERGKLSFYGDGPCEAIADLDRHIVVSIGWKPLGRFFGMLLGTKDIARDMEKKLSQPMRSYGWRAGSVLTKAVDGEKAEGYSYEYEAQGIGMYGESYALKHGKTVYYLHFYARKAQKDESLEALDTILASAKWR